MPLIFNDFEFLYITNNMTKPTVFLLLLGLILSKITLSQNCDNIVVTDKFTKNKGAVFYLEKYGDLTTTITFDQKADYPSEIGLYLQAGNFKGDNSRSAKYFAQKVSIMMYFIFEDGATKYISQDHSVAFGTSIFISKTDDIVYYLRIKK